MAPPRLVFPITPITGVVRHDEEENIVPRHPDAQSVPNVEDELILIRSGPESVPTLSRRDDVPRINGSEGASTTAIFILLRNHDPTPAERASRRRAHPSIRRPGVPHSLPIGLSHDRTLTNTGEDYTYTERQEQGYGHTRDAEGSFGGSFTEKLGNMFRSVGLSGRRNGSGWGRVNADQDWDSGDEDMDMLQRQQQDSNHLHPQYQYNPQSKPQRPYLDRQKSDQVEINVSKFAQHPEFIDDDRTTQHHHVGRSASHVTPTEAYGTRNLDLDSLPSTRASTPGLAGGTPGLAGSTPVLAGITPGHPRYAGRDDRERERDSTYLTSPSVYSTWSYRDPFDASSHPAPGPSIEGHRIWSIADWESWCRERRFWAGTGGTGRDFEA
ncbi:uncharacterized protein STEHIDRAFT_114344 [Stereum hirsutum FP-91666 SS1]|uniref:uncharacterized protein n=1 Tax=Stereum hirsutum (strain FP-91666) TaxID=721885 RepID=UPI000444978B|nr:uncharacterized protein STEHIDRAFT_114344 [Stereum hirsutum FP-91666 SS1]EIM82427.1 hypothetical protein STEHIDRAFT_114344 [Stereum hirsutum FP-91666 SS1]